MWREVRGITLRCLLSSNLFVLSSTIWTPETGCLQSGDQQRSLRKTLFAFLNFRDRRVLQKSCYHLQSFDYQVPVTSKTFLTSCWVNSSKFSPKHLNWLYLVYNRFEWLQDEDVCPIRRILWRKAPRAILKATMCDWHSDQPILEKIPCRQKPRIWVRKHCHFLFPKDKSE